MHSVRIELAKLILVGTRITYHATGDAGLEGFSFCFYIMFLTPVEWVGKERIIHDSGK